MVPVRPHGVSAPPREHLPPGVEHLTVGVPADCGPSGLDVSGAPLPAGRHARGPVGIPERGEPEHGPIRWRRVHAPQAQPRPVDPWATV